MILDWSEKIVHINKTDMILVQTDPVEIYQLDLYDFHVALHSIEESDNGIVNSTIHSHIPPKTVAGVILARVVEVINDYNILFEDGQYNVNVVGGNSNVSDRTIKNQVGVNTANSAGLQDLSSLQQASFGEGVVAMDQINGTAGTTYPIGTKGKPVNNWADAKTIANRQNISKILVIGVGTAVNQDDISDIQIVGTNPMLSVLSVTEPVEAQNVYVRELYFTGYLDGGTILRDCVVGAMQYFDGYMEHCALTANTIVLQGRGVIMNCTAGDTDISEPIIDLTNAESLSIRNYDGDIRLINRSSPIYIEVNMRGMLIIDDTVTEGEIIVYGDCDVVNNSDTVTLIDKTTGSPEEIADAIFNREIGDCP
jgi:hypothetical protein